MRGGSRLICCIEAEVVLLAASSWMRGGCRTAYDLKARRPKWSYLSAWSSLEAAVVYLSPRCGCEAAVALHVVLLPGRCS